MTASKKSGVEALFEELFIPLEELREELHGLLGAEAFSPAQRLRKNGILIDLAIYPVSDRKSPPSEAQPGSLPPKVELVCEVIPHNPAWCYPPSRAVRARSVLGRIAVSENHEAEERASAVRQLGLFNRPRPNRRDLAALTLQLVSNTAAGRQLTPISFRDTGVASVTELERFAECRLRPRTWPAILEELGIGLRGIALREPGIFKVQTALADSGLEIRVERDAGANLLNATISARSKSDLGILWEGFAVVARSRTSMNVVILDSNGNGQMERLAPDCQLDGALCVRFPDDLSRGDTKQVRREFLAGTDIKCRIEGNRRQFDFSAETRDRAMLGTRVVALRRNLGTGAVGVLGEFPLGTLEDRLHGSAKTENQPESLAFGAAARNDFVLLLFP